jgi:hypothetical protein
MTSNWFLLKARNKTSLEPHSKSPSNLNRNCEKNRFPFRKNKKTRYLKISRPIIEKRERKVTR